MKNRLGLKRGDIAVIALLCVLCAALFLFPLLNSDEGATAVVWHNGEQVTEIDLSAVRESYELTVGGCVLSVSRGEIRFLSADCPDGLCVKSGALSKNGDTAACLPNKVVVKIENRKTQLDAVAY